MAQLHKALYTNSTNCWTRSVIFVFIQGEIPTIDFWTQKRYNFYISLIFYRLPLIKPVFVMEYGTAFAYVYKAEDSTSLV